MTMTPVEQIDGVTGGVDQPAHRTNGMTVVLGTRGFSFVHPRRKVGTHHRNGARMLKDRRFGEDTGRSPARARAANLPLLIRRGAHLAELNMYRKGPPRPLAWLRPRRTAFGASCECLNMPLRFHRGKTLPKCMENAPRAIRHVPFRRFAR